MQLTNRAIKYLGSLKRIDELVLSKQETIDYCKQHNFPLTKTLLAVQTKFSGYKLTIRNDKGHSFLLRLFAKYDINENRGIDFYYFGNSYVVDFGEHDTAPFHFYITDSGELCTLGHYDRATPNIICSPIEKYIEQYALQNELASQVKDPHYYELLNGNELIKRLSPDFSRIEECSDKYSQWFTNGNLTVDTGTWLDRPESYLHIYGRDKMSINEFVAGLKNMKIIA